MNFFNVSTLESHKSGVMTRKQCRCLQPGLSGGVATFSGPIESSAIFRDVLRSMGISSLAFWDTVFFFFFFTTKAYFPRLPKSLCLYRFAKDTPLLLGSHLCWFPNPLQCCPTVYRYGWHFATPFLPLPRRLSNKSRLHTWVWLDLLRSCPFYIMISACCLSTQERP